MIAEDLSITTGQSLCYAAPQKSLRKSFTTKSLNSTPNQSFLLLQYGFLKNQSTLKQLSTFFDTVINIVSNKEQALLGYPQDIWLTQCPITNSSWNFVTVISLVHCVSFFFCCLPPWMTAVYTYQQIHFTPSLCSL